MGSSAASSVSSASNYVTFSLVIAGVAPSSFADQTITAAVINGVVYHILLWGVPDVNNASVSILSLAQLTLDWTCLILVSDCGLACFPETFTCLLSN